MKLLPGAIVDYMQIPSLRFDWYRN